jgi:Ni,Fe-hydrogenase III small subunit/formate hydrogenlyase subunit 6/NADH:ubiquinone oxidoreductase subunit I
MLRFLRTRLQQGVRTSPFPGGAVELPERFRGRPALDAAKCAQCERCAANGVSGLLTVTEQGRPLLDVGACRFAPEEEAACPQGALRFTREFAMASRTRGGLRSESGEIELAAALEEKARRLFGRSLRLRSVSAGSCNGCEGELIVLGTVAYDMARFGIEFVASPRHADGILVTGAVSRNMREALMRTYAATADPRLVIAAGVCAIDGGAFRGSPEVCDGVPAELPVDLWIPGCPPHPLTLLDGLLRLLGRIEGGERGSTGS